MIYFVQPMEGGQIKIGTTVQLSVRLRALEREYDRELRVLAVIDGSYEQEKALHYRFRHLRVENENEVFEPGDDLLAFILESGREWDGKDDKPNLDKTLKCSLSTYDLVRRVASLRGMDIKDYVDEVLKPIAQKQLREVARQIVDEE